MCRITILGRIVTAFVFDLPHLALSRDGADAIIRRIGSMTSTPTTHILFADLPATESASTQLYVVHLARRSTPEEHRIEHVSARNEAHALEMAAYLFAESLVLRVRPERRRATAAYPDARFIKGEFLPTAEADLLAGAAD